MQQGKPDKQMSLRGDPPRKQEETLKITIQKPPQE